MFAQQALLVGVGGALGAILRFGLYKLLGESQGIISTVIINITGCFVIGLVLGYVAQQNTDQTNLKLFLATGICGGFTTFSAFGADNFALLTQGKYGMAALYIFCSVVLAIAATFIGFKIIQ